ncbi:MAG: hypothetical protein M3R66_03260 [Actinomycetota bacterium]|nr:hypothetical protein [Actinomycetota bacterium]
MRRRLPGQSGPTGGPAYTDVLGIVEHCDAVTIRVRRADHTLVEILIADVARARRIPPPPVPRER